MIRTNDDIWKAGAFNNKRESALLLCERRRFDWNGVITVVERLLVEDNGLIIVISALGTDHQHPTPLDMTNASLATVVVINRRLFRKYRRNVRTYLEYANGAMREACVDVKETEQMVLSELGIAGDSRRRGPRIASSLFGYLLRHRWLKRKVDWQI